MFLCNPKYGKNIVIKIPRNDCSSQVEDSSTYEILDSSKDAYATYLGKAEAERVRATIEQLSTEFREIILLLEFEDLSYQEISDLILDSSKDAYATYLGKVEAERVRATVQQL